MIGAPAMAVLAALYATGVVAGLLAIDARLPARVGLALLWPLGPLAFIGTVTLLLAVALVAFPARALRRRTVAGFVLWALLLATPGAQTRLVDLGHPLREGDPSWTGKPAFEREGTRANGRFESEEHFGTHLDAPSHFGGQWTTEQIPVERLIGPGVVINVTGTSEDYQVTAADVKAFESRHGALPAGAIVLVATGWDARWPDRAAYMNERRGTKHFPGIGVEAARYLVSRKVAGIVIDTPSVDHGPSAAFETHNITNPANIYHVENARGLTKLPPTGFTVVVAPVNLAGGSGGPTRVFALLP